jgi:hypothetical protein
MRPSCEVHTGKSKGDPSACVHQTAPVKRIETEQRGWHSAIYAVTSAVGFQFLFSPD